MTGYKSLQKKWKGREDLNKIFKIFKIGNLNSLFQRKSLYDSMGFVEAETYCSKRWVFIGPEGDELIEGTQEGPGICIQSA